MSLCVKMDSIPLNIRNNINKDLEIKIENKYDIIIHCIIIYSENGKKYKRW